MFISYRVYSSLVLFVEESKEKSMDRSHRGDTRKRPREEERRGGRTAWRDFSKAPDPDEPEKMDEEAVQGLMAKNYSGGEDDAVVTLDACEWSKITSFLPGVLSCFYCCLSE